MKTLKFGEGLLLATLRGHKQITLRLYREEAHDLKKGEHFIADFFNEGVTLILEATQDTRKAPFQDLTMEELIDDGFLSPGDAFREMGEYYPSLTQTSLMGAIRFKIPEYEGTPIIQLKGRSLRI